jgi:hypothetical protein
VTSGFSEVLRRSFIAVATAEYGSLGPLPAVKVEVAALRDWLCDPQLGERWFTMGHPELADSPTRQQVEAALRDTAEDQVWTDADAACGVPEVGLGV